MQRMGFCIYLKAEKIREYKQLHAETWPQVLATISQCQIRNYTIYLKEPENILFASFEYHGNDYSQDMARMGQDPKTREWWALTDPCQAPFEHRQPGEWWAQMEEVFHCD